MLLSIVIVSFQVQECLTQCLASLARIRDTLSLQVIVVDNASTDASRKIVREQFAWVELIENSANLGFAKANNQGLARARGKYWLLLNPDTEIGADARAALSLLTAFMQEHPRAGACGPSLFYPDGARQHSAFRFPSLAQLYIDLFPVNWRLRASRLNGRYPFALYDRGAPFQIDHPLGAALLVRAETAAQVGVLDEAYFIYAEEVDWCMRIKRAGWEIWCVPAARIVHHEARSTRQFRATMFVELWRARFILFRKHYTRVWNAAARTLTRLGMRRAIRLVQAQAARGEISADDFQKQLTAYQTVIALSRERTE